MAVWMSLLKSKNYYCDYGALECLADSLATEGGTPKRRLNAVVKLLEYS